MSDQTEMFKTRMKYGLIVVAICAGLLVGGYIAAPQLVAVIGGVFGF